MVVYIFPNGAQEKSLGLRELTKGKEKLVVDGQTFPTAPKIDL